MEEFLFIVFECILLLILGYLLYKFIRFVNKCTAPCQARKLAVDIDVLDVFVRQSDGLMRCLYSSGKFEERVYSHKEFSDLFQTKQD